MPDASPSDRPEIVIADPQTPTVQKLWAAANAELARLYPAESIFTLAPAELAAPAVTVWVAQDGPTQMPLGCIALKPSAPGYGEIKGLYVQPAARRKGIAAQLLQTLTDHAHQQGMEILQLETGCAQPGAIALYQKFGFVQTGPFGDYGDDPYSVYYQKSLVGSLPAPRLCPVCQRVQPAVQSGAQSGVTPALCYHCDWPLEPQLPLSIAQQVWLRQRWRQVERQEHLSRHLVAQVSEQLSEPLSRWETSWAVEPASLEATESTAGQTPAIQLPSFGAADSATRALRRPTPASRLDYGPLQACLAAGDWRGADQCSAALLVAIAGRERQGYLTPEDLANLPTEMLLQMDHHWQAASNSRFGLAVQKQCHIDLSGNRARISQVWPHLAHQLGWCHVRAAGDESEHDAGGGEPGTTQWLTYDELQFTVDAPIGHLPVLGDGIVWFVGGWGGAFSGFTTLMSRLP